MWPICASRLASFDALATSSLTRRRLRLLGAHFGARALGVERVGDRRRAVERRAGRGADEVVGGAAVARVERAAQRARARLDEADDLELVRRRRRLHLERAPRVARAIEIELDQDQAADLRPAAVVQLLVRLPRALRDHLRRAAGADAGAAAADQRRRELELGRRALALGEPLRVGDHRLANRVDEVDRAQLAFLAEAGDDDGERARHRQHVLRVLPDVAEDLVRADAVGIDAGGERAAHRPADEPVDDAFGAGQRERAVVADDERLVHELEVGVEDRDVQGAARRAGARAVARRARVAAEHVGRRRRRRRRLAAARRPAARDARRRIGGRARAGDIAGAAHADRRRIEDVEQRRLAARQQLEVGRETPSRPSAGRRGRRRASRCERRAGARSSTARGRRRRRPHRCIRGRCRRRRCRPA